MRCSTCILVSLVAISGCAGKKQPPVDLAEEEATIRQLTQEWFAAETRRDMDASMAFLAPHAIIQGEGAPTISTAEAMRELYKGFFAQPYTDLAMESRTIVVARSGDMAYDVGPWKMVTATKTGKQEEPGKSTIIWKKTNGQWKAVVMSFSSDVPPAPPARK